MFDYLLKRLLILVPTFIGISILVWLVMTLAPGDPVPDLAGRTPVLAVGSNRAPEQLARKFADHPLLTGDARETRQDPKTNRSIFEFVVKQRDGGRP